MIRCNRARQLPLILFTVAALAATAGCSVRVVSGDADEEATTTTTTKPADEGSTPTTRPSDDDGDDESAATTDPQGSSSGDEPTDTTDSAPSAGGSLAEPISCDDFQALSPGGRMLSVYNGSAPASGCDDLVAPARVASDVFSVTAELAKSYGAVIDDELPSPLVADADCDDGVMTLVVENAFTAPLILWGVLRFDDPDGEPVAFKPYVTGVLQPGDQATIAADGSAYDVESCGYEVRPLVAPTGDLAPDLGGPETDGPQSSDSIEEWYPALMQAEDDARSSEDPADFPDFVEDIHSPDLWVQLFLDGVISEDPAPAPAEPDPESETTVPADGGQKVVLRSTQDETQVLYCSTIEAPTFEGVEGEFAFVMFEWAAPSSATAEIFGVGLYRRGSDNRWRYIGRTVHVWDEYGNDERDRCDPPPTIE